MEVESLGEDGGSQIAEEDAFLWTRQEDTEDGDKWTAGEAWSFRPS